MFPLWVYGLVALTIAVMAFGIGQLAPGLGVSFVALTSTLWTIYSAQRRRRVNGSA